MISNIPSKVTIHKKKNFAEATEAGLKGNLYLSVLKSDK
jgi:hypothetical protein